MRKYFGGKQPNMRDTVMLGGVFLGPLYCIFETSDTQHMQQDPALPDSQLNGTFWISDMEKSEHHHDVFIGKNKPRNLNKNDLIDRLHGSGVTAKGRKADIVSNAKENYTEVEENEPDKKEGWIGKPKGILQVLWK